ENPGRFNPQEAFQEGDCLETSLFSLTKHLGSTLRSNTRDLIRKNTFAISNKAFSLRPEFANKPEQLTPPSKLCTLIFGCLASAAIEQL
ncbi:hypothetical protein, partial [Pseudomonas cichorii]|uniref:hypothetical protein n=1 Tax=Pseudomonas cichorii TaxID=36746 RepID=UPI001C816DEB